jgi:hypothetical protein
MRGEIKTVKGLSVRGLSQRQVSALRKHAAGHTKMHIKYMLTKMRKGATFTSAHIRAMKFVGR